MWVTEAAAVRAEIFHLSHIRKVWKSPGRKRCGLRSLPPSCLCWFCHSAPLQRRLEVHRELELPLATRVGMVKRYRTPLAARVGMVKRYRTRKPKQPFLSRTLALCSRCMQYLFFVLVALRLPIFTENDLKSRLLASAMPRVAPVDHTLQP